MTTQRTLNELMYPAPQMWELIDRVQTAMPFAVIPERPSQAEVIEVVATAAESAFATACRVLGADPSDAFRLTPDLISSAGERAVADYMIGAGSNWVPANDLAARVGGVIQAAIMNVLLSVDNPQANAA